MLSLFSLIFVTYYQQYYLLPMVVFFIALSCVFLLKVKDLSVKNITLLPDGQFLVSGTKGKSDCEFFLKPNSRIGWIGCWLIYAEPQHINQSEQLFIFKDQLTPIDYSRLCRWVLRYT